MIFPVKKPRPWQVRGFPEKTEATHFIGGPCEEEKVACCVVASASGYSIVQVGLEVDLSGRTWGEKNPPVTVLAIFIGKYGAIGIFIHQGGHFKGF